MRILVVDDFLTMRRVVRGFLREMGFDEADVVEAAQRHGGARGSCARRRSTSSSPTSRCRSSAASGCSRRSRRTPRCGDVPVLMVTAEARKDEIVRCMQAGAAAYLVKPFTRETLEEKLRAAVPAAFAST